MGVNRPLIDPFSSSRGGRDVPALDESVTVYCTIQGITGGKSWLGKSGKFIKMMPNFVFNIKLILYTLHTLQFKGLGSVRFVFIYLSLRN